MVGRRLIIDIPSLTPVPDILYINLFIDAGKWTLLRKSENKRKRGGDQYIVKSTSYFLPNIADCSNGPKM